MSTADALLRTLESPNVSDQNLEPANVVDVLNYLALAAGRIAASITPRDAVAGVDANGGHVRSLTEAVMGIAGGLHAIASAVERLASAVETRPA